MFLYRIFLYLTVLYKKKIDTKKILIQKKNCYTKKFFQTKKFDIQKKFILSKNTPSMFCFNKLCKLFYQIILKHLFCFIESFFKS